MRLTDAAFEGAVERYGNTVFRLAYSYLKNRADAEDVMQETLLKLYLERKPFRSPEHERYWVVRVAVNESKKLLRSPWRRRTGPLEARATPRKLAFTSPSLPPILYMQYRIPVSS